MGRRKFRVAWARHTSSAIVELIKRRFERRSPDDQDVPTSSFPRPFGCQTSAQNVRARAALLGCRIAFSRLLSLLRERVDSIPQRRSKRPYNPFRMIFEVGLAIK